MLKRKKTSLSEAALAAAQGSGVDLVERDLLLDNLQKNVHELGFLQVLPAPVEERKTYFKHPLLEREFGARILELSSAPGSRSLVLCPTYFLSVFKRYVQNLATRGPHVAKWFYVQPVVEPAADELLTNHELGIFVLGEDSNLANAQLINAVNLVLNNLGIGGFVTEINSLGCPTCQKDYQELLHDHLRKSSFELCADCQENLRENPMLVWNCPNPSCQNLLGTAPQIADFLDETCRATLVGVLETVDELGIPYAFNPKVSGQLPSQKVLFRIVHTDSGVVLGMGGNYTALAEHLGGPVGLPLLGFVTTFEKLWPLIPPENKKVSGHVEVFMVPLGEVAARRALLLHRALREAGVASAEAMLGHASIKGQLKEATDQRSDIALIIGQKEALDDTVILRDMRSGMQEVFRSDRIIEEVKKRLGR